MLGKLLKSENLGGDLCKIVETIRQGVPSAVFNAPFAAKCHIVGNAEGFALYIVKDVASLEKTAAEIAALSDKKTAVLFPKDDVLLYNKAVSRHSLFRRLNGIYEIMRGAEVAVTTFEALLQLFPEKLETLSLKKGEEIEPHAAARKLAAMGYAREEIVDAEGCFSLRGDILEIFPINRKNPVRVDFFGDEIESIKEYDVESREKLGFLEEAEILAATDIFIENAEKKQLAEELKAAVTSARTAESHTRLKIMAGELADMLESGVSDNRLSVLMPLLNNATANPFDILPADTTVFFDECKQLSDGLDFLEKEHAERFKNLLAAGEAFPFAYRQLGDRGELVSLLTEKRVAALQTLTTAIPFFNPLKTFTLRCGTVAKYQMKFAEFISDVENWLFSGYRIVAIADTPERAKRLNGDLSEQGIASSVDSAESGKSGVSVVSGTLDSGFICHDIKLAVIGSGDLFSRRPETKKLRRRGKEFFSAPEAGDYAVHEVHGIGIVRGTKRISTTEGTKDYIAVEYAGGDVLYVSVEQLDVLSRYLGGAQKPSLSRIGGKDFDKIKERVKASIRAMSIDLKKLYASRAEKTGFRFTEDSEMQELFEARFPHELTEDQKQASLDILQDMCSEKVTDRLICGDVGYGKTEVALRAVFRAVVSGKQAALLAPTTILTQQHFNNAAERFRDFGVRVAVLNRFKSGKEQSKIIAQLKTGEIDFVIGTHRLLSSDVAFKDLGLLVLDEEQRFGVEHKEKIKLLKNNVDTLTLTATPIPRTLHMSLSGIRDISTINTPPKERLPVQTYVTEETDALLRDALLREINRGGQAFVLYNRVESIFSFADRLKKLLPEVRFTVAHGQMNETTLENAVMEFYRGETDVLVSTTIIENGIDLPRANTLVVIDADRLGLSTLYQLKGRVGRSNRLAHAYFTFKRDKVLSETAYKRLTSIMEFAELGSGFKIAMRDLEIRGAGNVLGREQHGHMDKVGYELYTKLLKEEMGEETPKAVELDVRVSAYIPEDYISAPSLRMDAYKEIAEISSPEEEERVKNELADLYGELPMEVEDLIAIASVKNAAAGTGVSQLTVRKGLCEAAFCSIAALNHDGLRAAAEKYKPRVRFDMSVKPALRFDSEGRSNGEMLAFLKEFFAYAASFSGAKAKTS
ncbi:MAG: transcription-repair coupling factor [Bacillota bacterium]|nr:MAG: transcription-repair coupling factor [Bacillota bacterium]